MIVNGILNNDETAIDCMFKMHYFFNLGHFWMKSLILVFNSENYHSRKDAKSKKYFMKCRNSMKTWKNLFGISLEIILAFS